MRHITIYVILVAFLFISCESDELTNYGTSNARKLVLSPAALEGEQYATYTFKARITNMPIRDPLYFWDFDEGKGFHQGEWIADTIFYQNKVHYVRVKAVDAFTEEVLGFDSIRADIRPPAPSVKISPREIDTVVLSGIDGRVEIPIPFYVKTSTPLNLVKLFWEFGDGYSYWDSSGNGGISYQFRMGTTMLRVSAYEKSGIYLGSDSVEVTLRFPPLSSLSFSTARGITAFLHIDTLHPIAQDTLFQNPFMLEMNGPSSKIKSQFSSNEFMVQFNSIYTVYPNEAHYKHDTIAGRFSDDYNILTRLRVRVQDSGYLDFLRTSPATLDYTYILKDLELYSINNAFIVYRTKPGSDFLTSVSFRASGIKNHPAGTAQSNITPVPSNSPYSFGMVIFER